MKFISIESHLLNFGLIVCFLYFLDLFAHILEPFLHPIFGYPIESIVIDLVLCLLVQGSRLLQGVPRVFRLHGFTR